MAAAYAAADLVVSRAGVGSISELELLGKPCILVPSPNVAEDHRTKNARALSDAGAALLVSDAEAREKLYTDRAGHVLRQTGHPGVAEKIKSLALPGSDDRIVDEALALINAKP